MVFDKEANHVVAIDKDDFELFTDLIDDNYTVFRHTNKVLTTTFQLNGHSVKAVKRILDRIACFVEKYVSTPCNFIFKIMDVEYLEEYGIGYALISCTSPETDVTPIMLRASPEMFADLSDQITCPESGEVISLPEYANALNRWLTKFCDTVTWDKVTVDHYDPDHSEDYYMFKIMEMAIEASGYDLTNVSKITITGVINDSDLILIDGSIE